MLQSFIIVLREGFESFLLVAVILTAMFGNAGNYGLSLNLFAFGDGALAYASLYFVSMSVIIYTFGVIIASLGSMSVWRAIVNLYRVPALYAVAAALIFSRAGFSLPLPLDRTVNLLGAAAIPVLMAAP